MSLQEIQAGASWDKIAQTVINIAIRKVGALPAAITAEIAAAITALKAAANTWSNTNNFTGTFQLAGVGLLAGLRGHIAGLTLSNNGTDATNDIDIAVGAAMAGDQSALIVLSSALTKQLDAAWAVGTNAGMLATGVAVANGTYHIFLIRRPDTGVVDIAADTSASGANIAANTNAAYTQKRRIGSIIRSAGAIVVFKQYGDTFKRAVASDRNSTAAAASALLTFSVPVGIVCAPIFSVFLDGGTSDACSVAIGDAADGSANITVVEIIIGAGDTSERNIAVIEGLFFTNTSAQLYFSQTNTAGTPTLSAIGTFGWIDRRGQDD